MAKLSFDEKSKIRDRLYTPGYSNTYTGRRRRYDFRWHDSGNGYSTRLYFPKEVFPENTNYVSLQMEPKYKRVILRPHLHLPIRQTNLIFRKVVSKKTNDLDGPTRYISFPKSLAETTMLLNTSFITDSGKIIIQLPDHATFSDFETWASSRNSGRTRNIDLLRVDNISKEIWISRNRWPANAEYIKFQLLNLKTTKYLDLLPVARSGHIAIDGEITQGQFVGLKGAVKVHGPIGISLRARGKKFFKTNPNINAGYWYLTNNGKQRPDGVFRYKPLNKHQFDEYGNEL